MKTFREQFTSEILPWLQNKGFKLIKESELHGNYLVLLRNEENIVLKIMQSGRLGEPPSYFFLAKDREFDLRILYYIITGQTINGYVIRSNSNQYVNFLKEIWNIIDLYRNDLSYYHIAYIIHDKESFWLHSRIHQLSRDSNIWNMYRNNDVNWKIELAKFYGYELRNPREVYRRFLDCSKRLE